MSKAERARQIDAEEFKRDSQRALARALAYSGQKQEERRRQFLTFAFGEEGNVMALDKLHAPAETDRSPVTLYTFGKQSFSAPQWAHRLGIEPDTLFRHAREHGSIEAAIAFCLKHRRKRTGKPAKIHECNGLKLTRHQWAKRLGIALGTFDTRVKKYGLQSAIAMGSKIAPGQRTPYKASPLTADDLTLSRREWAKRLGIAYTSFCGRVTRLGIEAAIAMGGPNPRGGHRRPSNDNAPANDSAPGVVDDFSERLGTGGGSHAQETPKISFSGKTTQE
jgi:hypothetical protein